MYAYAEKHILFLFPINNNNPDKKPPNYGCSLCMEDIVKAVFSFQKVSTFFLFITWQLETDSLIPLENLSKGLVTFLRKQSICAFMFRRCICWELWIFCFLVSHRVCYAGNASNRVLVPPGDHILHLQWRRDPSMCQSPPYIRTLTYRDKQ